MALLEIDDLTVDFRVGADTVHVLRGVSMRFPERSRTAIVGESGSGKTVSAMSALKLLPPNAPVLSGEIRFEGRDVLALGEREMREVRGTGICMVFQNAVAALNPVYPVGRQIADVHRRHHGGDLRAAWVKAISVLAATGIPDAERRAHNYPHEYSGGMAQRAMIAMALVCQPRLLIADEPTSGLDVTIQAQVLALIDRVVSELGTTLILITHDIGQIPEICDRIIVMYAGSVMEAGTTAQVMRNPSNPYTQLLLACFDETSDGEMPFIPGRVPDLRQQWPGCGFADRCPRAAEICRTTPPPMTEVASDHISACHFAR